MRLLGSQIRASSRYQEEGGAAGSLRAPRRGSPGVPGAGPSSAGGAGQLRGRALGLPLPAGTELPPRPSWRNEGNL